MAEPYRKFDEEEIKDIFSYHAPTSEQRKVFEKLNEAFIECAIKVAALLPAGPGKTVAIRALADTRMKANAAVALEGKF